MKQTHKKTMAAGMAVVMAMALPMTEVLAAAPQKDQTVYVNTDELGNVEKVIVSNWLKTNGKKGQLKDHSELENIFNVKGEETFKKDKDGSLVWNAAGSDIYYQGESKKELPVSVKMTYFLDGKKIEPSKLAGKSGKVKIRIDYENISDTKKEEYTPFLMVTGMILPSDTFSNIEVKNGRVISDGKNEIVVGFGFPGLKKALQVSEKAEKKVKKELPDYVEITADAKSFELGMTVTAATTGMLKELGLGDLADTEKLEEKLDLLSDSSKALKDGSQELKDGTQKLNASTDELTAGLGSADEGAGKLKAGIDTLNSKKGELTQGIDSLAGGAGELKNGADVLAGGSSEFRKQLGTYTGKVEELSSGLSQLNSGIQSSGDQLSKLPQAVEKLGGAIGQMSAGAAQFQQGASQVKDSAAAIGGQLEGLDQGLGSAQALIGMAIDAMNSAEVPENEAAAQQLAQAKAGLEAIAGQLGGVSIDSSAIKQLEEGASAAAAGAETMQKNLTAMSEAMSGLGNLQGMLATVKESVAKLDAGAKALCGYHAPLNEAAAQISSGAERLNSGMGTLKNGASALQTGAGALSDGIGQLASGASELKEGTGKLANGGRELKNGTSKLEEGAAKLAEGMEKFDEDGVQKLTDIVENELQGFLDRLKEVADADEKYQTFDGETEDMDSSVKFIIRTDEIKATSSDSGKSSRSK